MPNVMLRSLFRLLLKLLFRVRLKGFEHYGSTHGATVIICNHQSFLDPLLLGVFLPEKPAFVMNTVQAAKWYFKPVMALSDVYVVDPLQPISTKTVIDRLKEGRKVVIFPEGRITTTGGLMKIYEGTGLILDKAEALLLPMRIDGALRSKFSHMQGKFPLSWFPRITITMFAPTRLEFPAGEPQEGKIRRAMAAQQIADIMVNAAFDAAFAPKPLLAALIDAARAHGASRAIAEDIGRAPLSYKQLLTRAFVLAGVLDKQIGDKRYVAMLMPTSLGALVAFFSLHKLGRVPAMLNFSAGLRNLQHACAIAGADTIITSRAFVEKAELQGVVSQLAESCRIVYLEDMRGEIGLSHKLKGAACAWAARTFPARGISPNAAHIPAALIYTSGSEGAPKGVALSHANILANIGQASARIDFTHRDVLFNALPMFHSFGLTVGTLLPLMLGIRVFLYPSPLHYRIIPELVYDTDTSILLGTDTFFSGYARYADAYDFYNVRLAVAGAEKLKPATRQLYAERFNVNIMEGYGVTEMSPAMAFNTALEHKAGTVGRLFPRIQHRIEPVEGLSEGGKLFVRGPTLMLGYMHADKPGEVQPAPEWYDTGDIVTIDAEGYVKIVGRAKRFAKIGGEMVSLQQIEDVAAKLFSEQAHAAIAVADPRKGEHILLLSEAMELTHALFLQSARAEGLPEIAFPKRVEFCEVIPRLGTGKIDYMTLKARFAPDIPSPLVGEG